ncbi:serine hydrolase [Brevibacillus halotolerans]|uniref:serine hydrolase n=1 Tax=Brevibacillus TaxID=55080 RepID=UPI00215D45F7|nr:MULTISPECIES: serine hydrolase [Brevibacillus]MCR8966024.1 serine hydrolase [Brevibacillus laterosporus]MCZ0838180.1 serine hydrolase [Brevibacillus halotolerans]
MSIKSNFIELLDRIIKEYMDKESIPGLAVGIVKDKKIICAKGYGVKNVDTKEPINEYSLFHMASISKTFVALAIMKLVEDGSVKLDSYVTEYLPYFELKDEKYKNITIRQLLSHTSGIPNDSNYEWDKPQYDEEALERYVKSITYLDLMWKPGEKFGYSDTAFEVLGDVISKVSGLSFEHYMKENVLQVLGMKESHFYKPALSADLLTSPHILYVKNDYAAKVSKIFPYNRIHSPSSTLCSNAIEMCYYAIANLNKGSLNGQTILHPDSHADLWKSHVHTGWDGFMTEMGLSWFLGDYKGNKVVSHVGGDTGFRSELMILPEEGIAVVIMTNSDYVSTQPLCTTILDIVLEQEAILIKKSLAHHLARKVVHTDVDAALKYCSCNKNAIEEFFVNEGECNSIAHEWSKEKRFDKAIEMLTASIIAFPDSYVLYDSLGKMYRLSGEDQLAIKSYRKSLELNPENEKTKLAIKELSSNEI